MSKTVTESIFDGATTVIPMADVQHIQRHWVSTPVAQRTKYNYQGLIIVTKHTTWDRELDNYANNIYIDGEEAKEFLKAWSQYRAELEAETLVDP